jgi:hypothetical protein
VFFPLSLRSLRLGVKNLKCHQRKDAELAQRRIGGFLTAQWWENQVPQAANSGPLETEQTSISQ